MKRGRPTNRQLEKRAYWRERYRKSKEKKNGKKSRKLNFCSNCGADLR